MPRGIPGGRLHPALGVTGPGTHLINLRWHMYVSKLSQCHWVCGAILGARTWQRWMFLSEKRGAACPHLGGNHLKRGAACPHLDGNHLFCFKQVLPGILQRHCCIAADRNTGEWAGLRGERRRRRGWGTENSDRRCGSPGFQCQSSAGLSSLKPANSDSLGSTVLRPELRELSSSDKGNSFTIAALDLKGKRVIS